MCWQSPARCIGYLFLLHRQAQLILFQLFYLFSVTEVTVNRTTILFYSSIKELPIDQSKKMQNYLLQAVGIGSSIQDIDDHLSRASAFISADKKDECVEELKNLRFSMFSALNEIRYDTPAFACMIHSVDGKRVQDYSLEGLNTLITELSKEGLTNEKVEQILGEVKKNLIQSEGSASRTSFQTT